MQQELPNHRSPTLPSCSLMTAQHPATHSAWPKMVHKKSCAFVFSTGSTKVQLRLSPTHTARPESYCHCAVLFSTDWSHTHCLLLSLQSHMPYANSFVHHWMNMPRSKLLPANPVVVHTGGPMHLFQHRSEGSHTLPSCSLDGSPLAVVVHCPSLDEC